MSAPPVGHLPLACSFEAWKGFRGGEQRGRSGMIDIFNSDARSTVAQPRKRPDEADKVDAAPRRPEL